MQEKNLGLGVSQAFEFGQQFNKEYVPLSLLIRVLPGTELGNLDVPSWRSFRPMYSSCRLDWTYHSAGHQLYRVHEHCYSLLFPVVCRFVLYQIPYTTQDITHGA
jgi:hypothetical protein